MENGTPHPFSNLEILCHTNRTQPPRSLLHHPGQHCHSELLDHNRSTIQILIQAHMLLQISRLYGEEGRSSDDGEPA